MVSISGLDLTKGFSVDLHEVRQTASRQFFVSAVILFVVLAFTALSAVHGVVNPAEKGATPVGRDVYVAAPIKARVSYVDKSNSTHRIAIASARD